MIEGQIDRWHSKADSVVIGWRAKFGDTPTPHTVALCLSVAQHETLCGDSSVAPCNWGAVQKRSLRPDEKAALAAVGLAPAFPKREFIEKARHALEAAVEAGTVAPLDHEALFCDSTPKTDAAGKSYSAWYWIMFWAFPNDDEGAAFFVHVLAENRPSCRAVLTSPGGTVAQLADAMYRTRYFEGMHDPKAPGGAQANVADYAKALGRWLPEIQEALREWSPPVLRAPVDHVAEAIAARLSRLTHDVTAGQRVGLAAIDEVMGREDAVADTDRAPAPERG